MNARFFRWVVLLRHKALSSVNPNDMRVPHPVRTRSAQLAGQERMIGGDQVRDFPVTRSQCSPQASLSMWPSIAPTSSLTRKPVAKPKSSRKQSLWAAGADQPYDHSSPSAIVRTSSHSPSVNARDASRSPVLAPPLTFTPANGLAST